MASYLSTKRKLRKKIYGLINLKPNLPLLKKTHLKSHHTMKTGT